MAAMTAHLIAVRDHRDRAAFAALFAYFAPRIRRYLARQFPGTIELDDITQEVMILVWRRTATFDAGRSAASTWIFTVARNYRIDLLRRRNKSLVPVDALPDLLVDPSPEAQVSMVERERLMRSALVKLPDHLRRLLNLMYFEGLHHREIAAATGLPIGTVKSRISSAYRALQKSLAG